MMLYNMTVYSLTGFDFKLKIMEVDLQKVKPFVNSSR